MKKTDEMMQLIERYDSYRISEQEFKRQMSVLMDQIKKEAIDSLTNGGR